MTDSFELLIVADSTDLPQSWLLVTDCSGVLVLDLSDLSQSLVLVIDSSNDSLGETVSPFSSVVSDSTTEPAECVILKPSPFKLLVLTITPQSASSPFHKGLVESKHKTSFVTPVASILI